MFQDTFKPRFGFCLPAPKYMLLFSNMYEAGSDAVWKALADETRRRLLDLLSGRSQTTGELCEQFESLSRCAIMKHLGILEAANLVVVRREGKYRWNYINPVPIQEIYERWVSRRAATLAYSTLRVKNKEPD